MLPPQLETKLLTHVGHPASKLVGQNARFAFTGERFCLPPPPPLLFISRFKGCLTRRISTENRSSDPQSLFSDILALVPKRKFRRRLRENRLERPQHIPFGGIHPSGVGDRKGVEMEIDGGSTAGREGGRECTCWVA